MAKKFLLAIAIIASVSVADNVAPELGLTANTCYAAAPNNGESYHTETVTCDHCDGGYNYKQTYMGSGETRTIKSRCNWCHGTGTINKKVKY